MKRQLSILVLLFTVFITSGCVLWHSPKEGTVTLKTGEKITFSFHVASLKADYEWRLDGEVLPSSGPRYEYQASGGGPSLHILSVKAKASSREYYRTWNIVNEDEVEVSGIDLMPYARVTATGTYNSFLMMWPRETDDGAFTVRDGALGTSWKVPPVGKASLQIDFAPILGSAPTISKIQAAWNKLPLGTVSISLHAYKGGPIAYEALWSNPEKPFYFLQPASGYYMDMEVSDAGLAQLSELKVFSARTQEFPAVSDAVLLPEDKGFSIEWRADDNTQFIRIDYLNASDESASDKTLIEVVPAGCQWLGPWPRQDNTRISLTPLSSGGIAGDPFCIEPQIPPDIRRYPTMGVIEGFYGTLWSDSERRQMMLMLSRLGFGSYIYQPKYDMLNREQWRTPYSEEQIEAFSALRRFGERLGVRMVFGIAPAFDMIVDDPAERSVLLEKLAPLVEEGFRDFELGFDDIEFSVKDPVDAVMGAKHTDLVNWAHDRLSEMSGEQVRMWMMPTVYETKRQYKSFPEGSSYLDQLANLHQGIHILWNGLDTFSRSICAADLEDVAQRTGRKPVIWENMHCNDAGDGFIGKFYLAPLMNRSPDIIDAVEGYLTNPLIPGAANRLILGSYEQFFASPGEYDPDNAMPESISMEVADEEDRRLAMRLSENYWGLGILGPPGNSVTANLPMESAFASLLTVLEGNELGAVADAGGELLKVGVQMASSQNYLHHSGLRTDLVDDLWYPARRLVDEGGAILDILDWLAARLSGADNPSAMNRARCAILDSLLHDRYHTSQLKLFAYRLEMELSNIVAMGFETPEIGEPLTLEARTGDAWIYDTGVPEGIEVFGLKGASQMNGVISWTPAHPGEYAAFVIARNETGWSYKRLSIRVSDIG